MKGGKTNTKPQAALLGVRCVVSRYGLRGKCHLMRYKNDGEDFIEGECELVS